MMNIYPRTQAVASKTTHNMLEIPFNKPYLSGKEISYIQDAIETGKISGNGKYTQLCQEFFKKKYNFGKCLLTTSCTDALEMAALLVPIEPGDEVILPSYTFVSTANAFVLRGAKLVFVDSRKDHPGMDESEIEKLITTKTKVIVPVHYAGVACDMDKIMDLAARYDLFVVEDAAHGIDSYYTGRDGKKRALGSIGHLAAFSFHETKNVISGEGGMLVINDDRFKERAEIIWEKGTNRAAFFKGEVDKYGWMDVGSSFSPSEIIAAFLWGQLENLDRIQEKRISIWENYYEGLKDWAGEVKISLPTIPLYASKNGHMFYLVANSGIQRDNILRALKERNIMAVFHYINLHKSPFYQNHYYGGKLRMAQRYTKCLVRLPFFYELDDDQVQYIHSQLKALTILY